MSTPEDKFATIYDRFYGRVYNYCVRRTDRTSVDDVVATVFLAAWRLIESVPEDDEALYWLYRVAYRTIGKQWRGDSRRQRLEKKLAGLGREIPVPPEDYVIQDEDSRNIIEAAYRLRPTDREALLLADWEELSGKEIARVLSISAEAAKKRVQRARENLAREYDRIIAKQYLPAAQEGGAR